MTNAEKTVFISYRRDTSRYLARAIYQDLQHNGYDVFLDVESIDSGTFDTIILNQISARAHFIVILEPGSEKRLAEPGDWLRQEVERAIELKRNIVPILAGNFSFTDAKPYLVGSLEELPRYNGVPLHRDYFEEAMDRLRSRFLKRPKYVDVIPTPAGEREIVEQKMSKASQIPAPTPDNFTAEFLLNRGADKAVKSDFTGAIEDLTAAIALDGGNTHIYWLRGSAYSNLGQHDKAIIDFNTAIALDPGDASAYAERGIAYQSLGQMDKAMKDLNRSIALDPKDADLYLLRGVWYSNLGQLNMAIKEFDQAIALAPENAIAYYKRAMAYHALDQMDKAIKDCDKSIALNPKEYTAYVFRGTSYHILGQMDKAIKDYDRAIALDPEAAEIYFARGQAYANLGQYGKALFNYRAIENYSKAIELNPQFAPAYAGRGNVYKRVHLSTYAAEDRARAIALDPSYGGS